MLTSNFFIVSFPPKKEVFPSKKLLKYDIIYPVNGGLLRVFDTVYFILISVKKRIKSDQSLQAKYWMARKQILKPNYRYFQSQILGHYQIAFQYFWSRINNKYHTIYLGSDGYYGHIFWEWVDFSRKSVAWAKKGIRFWESRLVRETLKKTLLCLLCFCLTIDLYLL